MREILIASLATWRIASILANENGPMWIFSNLRAFVQKKADEGSAGWLSLLEGIECVWCNSIWFAMIFAIFLSGSYMMNVLAISALAIFIDSVIGKLNG